MFVRICFSNLELSLCTSFRISASCLQCCRYLTEEIFKKPVIVYNYPKGIKAFYMRLNDDLKTVAAMDVLVPKVLLDLLFIKAMPISVCMCGSQ
jgi:hypothetical protein